MKFDLEFVGAVCGVCWLGQGFSSGRTDYK